MSYVIRALFFKSAPLYFGEGDKLPSKKQSKAKRFATQREAEQVIIGVGGISEAIEDEREISGKDGPCEHGLIFQCSVCGVGPFRKQSRWIDDLFAVGTVKLIPNPWREMRKTLKQLEASTNALEETVYKLADVLGVKIPGRP